MEAKRRTNPNWLQLPIEITANILFRLNTVEILNSVRKVCPLWWKICKNPLMWQTIRMEDFEHVNLPDESDDNQLCDYLGKICRYAVDLSCGNLKQVFILGFATDDLVKYIADRASQLRCITLEHCDHISKEGLIELGTKLPLLEKLDISVNLFPGLCLGHKVNRFLMLPDEFRANCNDEAFAIAKTMPGLRHLNISGNALNDAGLLAILDGCPLLETLDIDGCFLITESLEDKCYDRIKDLRVSEIWLKLCFNTCEMNKENQDDSYLTSYSEYSSDSDADFDSSDSDSDFDSSDSEIPILSD